MEALVLIADLLKESRRVVALTGAGVSTASGIPDFRSPETGIWSKVDPSSVATIDVFRRDPVTFWSFYADRFAGLSAAFPNPAHFALARLEQLGYLSGLVTQNIDRLHVKAGSINVAEVHGSVSEAVCLECGAVVPSEDVLAELRDSPQGVPFCRCGYPLKPNVVLFGEELPGAEMRTAMDWAARAEVMIVVGTSLTVWPVAGLPELTVAGGGKVVILNDSATPFDRHATYVERSPVEQSLPRLVELLGEPAGVPGRI
jgi:NAD-dependent deacetylase